MSGAKAGCTEGIDDLRRLLGATAREAMEGSKRLREERVQVQRTRSLGEDAVKEKSCWSHTFVVLRAASEPLVEVGSVLSGRCGL